MARVIIASSAGTAFEWYDFFIFGSLAPVISKVFFAGLDPTPALIAALGSVRRRLRLPAAGRADLRRRSATGSGARARSSITVSLMGGATFLIGLLPTYAQAGIARRRSC